MAVASIATHGIEQIETLDRFSRRALSPGTTQRLAHTALRGSAVTGGPGGTRADGISETQGHVSSCIQNLRDIEAAR